MERQIQLREERPYIPRTVPIRIEKKITGAEKSIRTGGVDPVQPGQYRCRRKAGNIRTGTVKMASDEQTIRTAAVRLNQRATVVRRCLGSTRRDE